jgi:hypothetical protein
MDDNDDPLEWSMGSQGPVIIDLQQKINEGIWNDPNALGIIKQVKFGKERKFS